MACNIDLQYYKHNKIIRINHCVTSHGGETCKSMESQYTQ